MSGHEMDWRQHVTVDPVVRQGQACVRGTRIPVSVAFDNLASDVSTADLLKGYPSLTPAAVQAALAYAAELARVRVLAMP